MRIGLVGAGVIGRLRARSIIDNPLTELVSVMDLSREAARAAATGSTAQQTADLREFMSTDMDAVIVSTPPRFHEEACVEALRLGRHVLCEKPLANSRDAARRIVDAALETDRVLAVGFNLRYYPAISFVKDMIDEGAIGTLDHIRLFGGHDGLSQFRADWQYKAPDSGGGAMWDIGIHLTDLARHFLGEITEVCGVMSETIWNVHGSEDNAIAVFRSPDGVAASYQATWTEWRGYRFSVEAYGSHGMVQGSYAPMRNLLIGLDRPGGRKKVQRRLYPGVMVREKLRSWETTALISFEEELQDFLRRTEGPAEVRLADGYAGLRSIEVAAAVRESSESGDSVRLPPLGRM